MPVAMREVLVILEKPRQTRWKYIVMGTIVIACITAIALTLGLVYGLKSNEDAQLVASNNEAQTADTVTPNPDNVTVTPNPDNVTQDSHDVTSDAYDVTSNVDGITLNPDNTTRNPDDVAHNPPPLCWYQMDNIYLLETDEVSTHSLTWQQLYQPQKDTKLRVIYVRSDGLVGDFVNMTIEYEAAPGHSVDWRYIQQGYWGRLHSRGTRVKVKRDGINVFQCSNTVSFRSVHTVFIHIYSGIEIVSVQLLVTKLQNPWTYTVPVRMNFVHVTSSIESPSNGALNMALTVNGSVDLSSFAVTRPDIFITALNTSADPPTVFEKYDSLGINSSSKKTSSSTTQLTISIEYGHIQYGGILTILLPEVTDRTFVDGYKHGLSIEIVPYGGDTVIPRGVFGLYDMGRKSPFYAHSKSVICFALGNPPPEVQILKESTGNTDLMKSETVVADKWSRMVVATLHDRHTQAGNYTCRYTIATTRAATSGTSVIEVTTEVFAAEAPQILTNETGVAENTTSRVVVRCSATGIPAPSLTFKLFYQYGPDMIKSDRYQHERNVTATSASLTMTISPVDSGIHQVWCVGRQPQLFRTSFSRIVLFPTESTWNHTLYQQLLNEQRLP